jgi:hypothetical protein
MKKLMMYKNADEVKKRRFSFIHIFILLLIAINSFYIYNLIDDAKEDERYRSSLTQVRELEDESDLKDHQIDELLIIIRDQATTPMTIVAPGTEITPVEPPPTKVIIPGGDGEPSTVLTVPLRSAGESTTTTVDRPGKSENSKKSKKK